MHVLVVGVAVVVVDQKAVVGCKRDRGTLGYPRLFFGFSLDDNMLTFQKWGFS